MQEMLWLRSGHTEVTCTSSRTTGGIAGPAGSHLGTLGLHDCSNEIPKQDLVSEPFTVQVLVLTGDEIVEIGLRHADILVGCM